MKELLLLAEIPRSTYYYWVKNLGRPDPDTDLKELIQSIFDEHEGRYVTAEFVMNLEIVDTE